MAAIDAFGYTGKRVLVVGGASGIGAAASQLLGELGATVVVADFAEVPFDVAQAISLDLRDPVSVEAAVGALDARVDAIFSCAGISTGDDVMRVNVVGQLDLIERCLAGGLLGSGSAIGMIASGAGLGWQLHKDQITELLETEGFEARDTWVGAHPELNSYAFSKEVVIAYCFRQAFSFIEQGIRINALCPSSTDTPLARRSFGWLEYGTDYREATGIEVAKPIEQAYALAFLCSAAASYVSGAVLSVDAGVNASRTMGTFVPAPPSMPAATD